MGGGARRLLWHLLQWTWCLPQNIAGLCLCLMQGGERRRFRGAWVTPWAHSGCASLGCFLFMEREAAEDQALLVHEYGHTLQSAVLGWLYLPVIVVPSVLWFSLPACRRFRRAHGYSYYRFYTERWASDWGERVCGMPAEWGAAKK